MIQLPKTDRELADVFKKALVPDVSEFNGEYRVRMPTNLPSLTWLSHRKTFYPEKDGVSGCNVLFRNLKWGHFRLETGLSSCSEQLDVVTINYDRVDNTPLTRGIRDHVRRVREGYYLGKFNIILKGKPRFLGYFSLDKIV